MIYELASIRYVANKYSYMHGERELFFIRLSSSRKIVHLVEEYYTIGFFSARLNVYWYRLRYISSSLGL